MFKFLALLALLAALGSAVPVPRPNAQHELSSLLARLTAKIINGTETTIQENPHQISIRLKGYGHWCGGSLLSYDWILTAAHCLAHEIEDYEVVAGTANQFGGGSSQPISEKIIHEKYNINEMGILINDIALIRLKYSFVFDPTKESIGLYGKNEEAIPGSICVITGWGETEQGVPDILNRVEVAIISKKRCNELYGDYGGVPDGQICAADPNGGKDASQGDSGGPLVIDGRQAGIISWGIGCASPKNPGVYTEIAYYRDWIKIHSGV